MGTHRRNGDTIPISELADSPLEKGRIHKFGNWYRVPNSVLQNPPSAILCSFGPDHPEGEEFDMNVFWQIALAPAEETGKYF
jgi:hypothetical protein